MANKKQLAEFRKIEIMIKNFLEPFMDNSVEKHFLTGQELLEWGFTHDPNDETKKINPAAHYIYNQPVQMEVNHYRRIKKAFEQRGRDGVNDYFGKLYKCLTRVEEKS